MIVANCLVMYGVVGNYRSLECAASDGELSLIYFGHDHTKQQFRLPAHITDFLARRLVEISLSAEQHKELNADVESGGKKSPEDLINSIELRENARNRILNSEHSGVARITVGSKNCLLNIQVSRKGQGARYAKIDFFCQD